MVDVLLLNYNDYKTTLENAERLEKCNSVRIILIVDNCSTDDSYSILKKSINDKVKIIKTENNGGYGYGNNFGIRYLIKEYKSKYILLANPDTIIKDETIYKLKEFLEKHNDYAIVAPFMLDKNKKKMYNTAFKLPTKWQYILSLGLIYPKIMKSNKYRYLNSSNYDEYIDVGTVSGSLFMFDAKKMNSYGMYDENVFLYCEEVVLGLKMKKYNQKIALLLSETFIHNHSVSISKTYKSEIKKRKVLIKSKLYVIRKYYHANYFEYFYAYVLSQISIFERALLSLIKKVRD